MSLLHDVLFFMLGLTALTTLGMVIFVWVGVLVSTVCKFIEWVGDKFPSLSKYLPL